VVEVGREHGDLVQRQSGNFNGVHELRVDPDGRGLRECCTSNGPAVQFMKTTMPSSFVGRHCAALQGDSHVDAILERYQRAAGRGRDESCGGRGDGGGAGKRFEGPGIMKVW
jgi:hypothetical protein